MVQWKEFHPPNTPLYKARLPRNMVQYLWARINKAKEDKILWGDKLAGNIDESLLLDDPDEFFMNTVIGPLAKQIIRKNPMLYAPPLEEDELNKMMVNPPLTMSWWVNFQNELEFNPQHAHGGIVSFVIWMKIPTNPEEQHSLSFKSTSASDFQFTYTNILGEVTELPIMMDKTVEGCMMVFPSKLRHQVYPFYNCKDNRISIAGNILYKLNK